jgi:hypothetical protein
VVVAERLIAVSVAVMVIVPVVPVIGDVARPFEPAVLLIVTAVSSDELQVDADVQFRVVPSENFAMAANCCAVPFTMVGLLGITVIDSSFPPRVQLMKPTAVTVRPATIKIQYFTIFINYCLLGLQPA